MEQPRSFSDRQREVFAKMLQDAKKRAEEEVSDDEDRAETDVVTKLAEEQGVTELVAKMRKLRKEADDTEEALRRRGFACDGDSISLCYNAPASLRKARDTVFRAARAEREAPLKKYDRAILGVWAAETLPEAKKIVEQVL